MVTFLTFWFEPFVSPCFIQSVVTPDIGLSIAFSCYHSYVTAPGMVESRDEDKNF